MVCFFHNIFKYFPKQIQLSIKYYTYVSKKKQSFEILKLYTSGYKNVFYLREISKLLKLPLKTVQNTVQDLESERIMKSRIEGKNKYFALNLSNIKTKLYLILAEIYKTFKLLETYPLLNPFLKELTPFVDTPVLVFGSFADFTTTKESDLDLLVISDSQKNMPYHTLPFKVHEIKMNQKTFLESIERGETLISEIFRNHVILNSHDYFVNVWWEKYGR